MTPCELWFEDRARRLGHESGASAMHAMGLDAAKVRTLYRTHLRDLATGPEALPWGEAARTRLQQGGWRWEGPSVSALEASEDGQTTKALLRLDDDREVETVLMRHHGRRNTVCVSSQAGCAMRCAFCATGQAGFSRHLGASEIVDQVRFFQIQLAHLGERVTNVVVMGMGEPFHNYAALVDALRILSDDPGLAVGTGRITVSTVGLVPEIRAFADEGLGVQLAVSLHAPSDELRSALMPINDRWPLRELFAAMEAYAARTGRKVFLEYLMLTGFNDGPEHAHELAGRLQGGPYHLNLIPYNPTPGAPYEASPPERVRAFQAIVREAGVPVTVRVPMGREIAAACGQLQSRTQPRAAR